MPESWPQAAEIVMASPAEDVRQQARQLGVVFGDGRAIDALREIALDALADVASRRSALTTLVAERVPDALPLLKQLFNDAALTNEAIDGFAAFEDAGVPRLILDRYGRLDPDGQQAAISTLTSRPSYAQALLRAVDAGQINSSAISAYHARQIRSLQVPALEQELARLWGSVRETSAQKQQQIAELQTALDTSPLTDVDLSAGRRLFEKTCSSCHVLYGQGGRIGPDLTGSNRHNLNYLLENIVDPSASVNKEFMVSTVVLVDGRVLTGVVTEATERTVSVQTQKELLVLSRDDVEEMSAQDSSLMPDGLLQPLTGEQIRDLFAYLSSRSQVPLSDDR